MRYLILFILPFIIGCSNGHQTLVNLGQTLGCLKMIRKMQADNIKIDTAKYINYCNIVHNQFENK